MKKKILAVAIASALVGSPAMAAQDTSGMHFTSASEGFYASLRAEWNTGGSDKNGSNINEAGSRFGVSGDNDLGGGLTGFYTYEAAIAQSGGTALSTRHLHVGLRGGFGQVIAGQFWSNPYNFTTASTDIANNSGGNFSPMGYRVSNALEYTTPDLNGFQGVIQIIAKNDTIGALEGADLFAARVDVFPTAKAATGLTDAQIEEGATALTRILDRGIVKASDKADDVVVASALPADTGTSTTRTDAIAAANALPTTDAELLAQVNGVNLVGTNLTAAELTAIQGAGAATTEDDNDVDTWRIAAKYDVAGFSTGAGYSSQLDGQAGGNGREDLNAWVVKLGYAQDNWYVNGWYAENNASDGNAVDDTEYFSIAGGVAVDKVNVYAFYEQQENNVAEKGNPYNDGENSYATVGVQYNLGAQSRVYVEYLNRDLDSDKSADDIVLFGLRHDF